MGSGADSNSFLKNLDPARLTYDGVFNESFIRCSTTDLLLEHIIHVGVNRKKQLFLGVEVVSNLDGKERGPTPLDIVFAVDVSGSMDSPLVGTSVLSKLSKLSAAKLFVSNVAKKMRADDRLVCSIALVTYLS